MSNLGRSVDEIIGLLGSEGGVAHACGEVESWAKAGRSQDLATLAAALEDRCDGAESAAPSAERQKTRGRFETVADHVEDQLALAVGNDAIDALLLLSLADRKRTVTVPRTDSLRVRAFASRLGYGHAAGAFLEALDRVGERGEHQELFACWMQEVVLRGASLSDDARARRFKETLVNAGHPLSGLPLALCSSEREAPSYMPLYGDKGLSRAIDTLASGAMSARTVPPPSDGATVRATRVDDPEIAPRLRAAVRPWGEGKSGKIEAKVFQLDPAVDSMVLGSWLLRALPLEATTATARLECSRTGPEGVLGPLFSAASNGGAYSSGLGGAYGRLAAWTSLGALVGSPVAADVGAVEALARTCTFLSFRAPGPWFHDVAWDLGALVLRPGGHSVAVLAASDTE